MQRIKPIYKEKQYLPRVTVNRNINNLQERSVIIPRNITVSKMKSQIDAYRSSISNLFTDTDITLSSRGYLRLFTDQGYYGDIQKSLTMIEQDDLVNGLSHNLINLANSRMNFNLPSSNRNEIKVWETWARNINISVKNVLPGVDMLNYQHFFSMIATGMSVPDFKWGKMSVGRREYEMPMEITLIPSLGTNLSLTDDMYSEEVYAGVSQNYYNEFIRRMKENATTDQEYRNLFLDVTFDKKNKKAMLRKNAYAIKFRYTPNNKTLYPTPFLKPSFESIALRHKLLDADISLLEMIINKIVQIKVGDKDNRPLPDEYGDGDAIIRKGDLRLASELFENMTDEVEVIATPYYYEIKIVMPDTTVLLDQKKYVQSTYNILSNFGILLDPSSTSNTTNFDFLNIKNYEKNAISLQKHVAGWYTWLATQIIARNGDKLKQLPNITFDEPEIQSNNTLNFFKQLFDSGALDIYTLLDKAGVDKDTVRERLLIQKKEEKENPGLYEPRATFRQEVVNSNGRKTNEKEELKKVVSVSEDTNAKIDGGHISKRVGKVNG